jgi:hypothetical protein
LASEGSTNEWKATAQTAYTPRHPPTVSRTDGRRCCRVDKGTANPPKVPQRGFPAISRRDGQTGSIHAGKFACFPLPFPPGRGEYDRRRAAPLRRIDASVALCRRG